jgi:DNA polymerase III alpha subunit
MLPLFKSDFSIGKSILNLNEPNEHSDPGGSDSIFDIFVENNLPKLILVEDNLSGFLQAFKNSKKLGIDLIFGLRISVCSDASSPIKKNSPSDSNKIILFAKNEKGCRDLNKIYSHANVQFDGRIDYESLSKLFSQDLDLVIPFYDSFIFNNSLYFSSCVPSFSFCDPKFFIERNNLPFDSIIENKVKNYCEKNKYQFFLAKSIYYKNKSDFSAFQTYKCICSRNFFKSSSLEKPNLDHCSSDDFSFESFLQHEST